MLAGEVFELSDDGGGCAWLRAPPCPPLRATARVCAGGGQTGASGGGSGLRVGGEESGHGHTATATEPQSLVDGTTRRERRMATGRSNGWR
jgi:hypothetical protein